MNRPLILFTGLIFMTIHGTASAYEPTSNYTVKDVEGWKVYVNNGLSGEHPQLCEDALKLLDTKLYEVARVVPATAAVELRKTPIWVEYDDPKFPCAVFHPSREWLTENDVNPDKAGCIEIANVERFLKWTLDQPSMALHELAHAYFFAYLGDQNAGLSEAYQEAVESKSYESVLRYSGNVERHYALNNVGEYFAEGTEAYFGVNDFYPFVRAELGKHDPKLFGILESLWGVRK